MVLHNIANDAKLIEVTSATLSSKRLLERDDDGGDVVAVPCGTEEPVAKPDGHQVLHHFLAKVVVDTVKLFFFEEGGQVVGKSSRGLGILPERLLNDDAGPTLFGHGGLLQVGRDRDEDGGRQGQVEEPVGIRSA